MYSLVCIGKGFIMIWTALDGGGMKGHTIGLSLEAWLHDYLSR